MSTMYVDNIVEKTSTNGVHIPGHVIQYKQKYFDIASFTSTAGSMVNVTDAYVDITPKFSNSLIRFQTQIHGKNADSLGYDMYYDIRNNWGGGFDAENQCTSISSWNRANVYDIVLYEIELEEGEAISFLVNGPYLTTDVNCEDGYGTGLGNGTNTAYIGGQSVCTVSGTTSLSYYTQTYNTDILDIYTGRYIRGIQWVHDCNTPESFAIYFNLNQVEVHNFEE